MEEISSSSLCISGAVVRATSREREAFALGIVHPVHPLCTESFPCSPRSIPHAASPGSAGTGQRSGSNYVGKGKTLLGCFKHQRVTAWSGGISHTKFRCHQQ